MKVIKTIIIVVIVVGILGALSFCGLMVYNISPVEEKSETPVNFIVDEGMGQNAVIDKLEKEGLIRSAFFLKIYLKIYGEVPTIKAGRYEVTKDKAAIEILTYLGDSKNIITATVTVKFIEGKKFPYYVSKIAENFDFTEETIYNLTNDETYLKGLINKYWFIDESILNKDLYYPLEGYLFPDTYKFRVQATLEEILDTLLGEMDKKLTPYKEAIESSNLTVHEILTMASIVELEGKEPDDRKVLAGVFYNRLDKNMAFGSDVTTYYAAKKEMTEPILQSELDACNAYNTRGNCVKGLPVGPICSPSNSSIIAAIEPTSTSYLYFVADKNTKLYFGETYTDHQKNISDLKKKGLWPE